MGSNNGAHEADQRRRAEEERNTAQAQTAALREQFYNLQKERDFEKMKQEEKRKIDENNRFKEREERNRIQLENQKSLN